MYRTQFDPNYKGSQGQINTKPSKVQPDMTLTIKQLLINHTRGIPSHVQENQGHYFETEIPQITDLTELHKYQEELKHRENELMASLSEELRKKALEHAEQKKALETSSNKLDEITDLNR